MKEKELEKILKVLANERRLRILTYLRKNGEASVGDISENIGLSFRSTSRHLTLLFALDILRKEQRSSQVYYSLAKKRNIIIKQLLNNLS